MPDEDQDGAAKKRARGEEEELGDGGSADAGPAKKARTEEDAAGEDQDGAAKKPQRDEKEEQADGGSSDAGPSKKARTENAAGAEVGDAATNRGPSIPTDAADATEAGPTEAAETGAGDVKVANEEENLSADEPKKIGYKLFKDGKEAATYFRTLLNALTQRQPLNEYEFHMVLELLKNGHPEPEKKMGSGVKAIIVRKHQTEDSNCFFLLRTDGSMDDFSVFKCINRLFPAFGKGRGSMDVCNAGGSACAMFFKRSCMLCSLGRTAGARVDEVGAGAGADEGVAAGRAEGKAGLAAGKAGGADAGDEFDSLMLVIGSVFLIIYGCSEWDELKCGCSEVRVLASDVSSCMA
ncbi:hypothetical protein COCSUDRAFT_47805 [Coccomyxa subellipsoidea C-169]|uniref:Uncharacterized protein n=1 Tax=Coccomyxa subellipsoidea (strain C-169) TaxID=574566 RepID=I0YV48_COCSC|nr:hypothetical protein COCSUDRAFT_47805 [Coccomyxa subellipsoidea C-169]EIE22267.1 hypothetical protein COCSUDRAFT_47805 [Coccomyxa subellipsoidea C-169]|eukprot:XP_005646811.1 hypothetical protein COCSUDRAFT_47805 [Coccomyxa subellipsoidea C-169]